MFRRFSALAVTGAVLLTGCGGGGGDDGPTLTTLTEANAALASSVVYKAASALFDVAIEGPLSSSVGAVGAASADQARLGLVPLAASRLRAAMDRDGRTAFVVGATFEESYPCSGGGTETIAINDADDSQTLSNGDTVEISYASCVEDGLTFNGRIAVGDLQVTSETVYEGELSFDDFSVSGGGDVVGADGAMNLAVDETPGRPAVYEVSGSSLTTSFDGDRHRLQDFSGVTTIDALAGRAVFRFEGRVSDSSNAIVVDARSLVDFVALTVDDYPSSGQMRVTGASNSRVLLSALSATQVRIVVDENGDGSYEKALPDMSWEALASMQD